MHLQYIQLDDRLDAALTLERRAFDSTRRDFRQRYLLGWIYHELGLEGIPLSEQDLRRALAGHDGDHYREGVAFNSIRRMRDTIVMLTDRAFKRGVITVDTILAYHRSLTALEGNSIWRTDEGATEQYKHDTIDASRIHVELEKLCADIQRWTGLRHPLEIAIQTHYRLTHIWPFERFSAAVARMISNEILLTHGYPPALLHLHDRQRYYHAMHYDVSRLQELVLESLNDQIALRERVFAPRSAPRHEVRAY